MQYFGALPVIKKKLPKWMKKKISCLIVIMVVLLGCAGKVRAQHDAALSHYFMATSYYNPAAAGSTEDLRMLALYNQMWVGWPRASRTVFVNADMPLKIKKTQHGVGLAISYNGEGLSQYIRVGAQYAYKQKLFGGVLSGGVQIALLNQVFQADSIYIPQSDYHQQVDEAFPTTNAQAMALDINVGLFYTHTQFYAGVGYTHITNPTLQLEETVYTWIGSLINFMAGYNIPLRNPLYELQPSVFFLTDMTNFHTDITARLEYNKMFNGGIAWRVNESVGLLLGAKLGRFQVGYAYSYPTTAVRKATTGNHEIVVQYRLKLNKTKSGKNKHKSVRIL